jgi:hypothetical protein
MKWLKNTLASGFGKGSMLLAAVLDPVMAIAREIPGLIKSALINLGSSVIKAIQSVVGIFQDIINLGKGQLSSNFVSGIQGVFKGIKDLGVDIWNAIKNVYEVIKIASLRTADVFLSGYWIGNKIMDWLVPYEPFFKEKQNVRIKIFDYLNKNLKMERESLGEDIPMFVTTYTLSLPSLPKNKRQLRVPIGDWGNLKDSDKGSKFFKEVQEMIKNDHPQLASYIEEWSDYLEKERLEKEGEESKEKEKNNRYKLLKNFKKVESDV